MKIGLFNETNEDLKEYFKIMRKVLKIGLKKLKLKDVYFNVIIVDNKYIHNLNREYRNIDRETDVITFALFDDDTFNPKENILGDIYISIDKVYEQANLYNHSREREICFLAVHGLLHLLGYDHMNKEEEEEMFKLQDEILEASNVTR